MIESGLPIECDESLVSRYLGGRADPAFVHRVGFYRTLSDVLWAAWSLVQLSVGNPADDSAAYGACRLDRAREAAESPAFASHVCELRALQAVYHY